MNKSDITRDYCMLRGPLAKKGYDWWWHSFTAHHKVTGQAKTFYIEYFLCNPALAQPEPVLVWNDPEGRAAGNDPRGEERPYEKVQNHRDAHHPV